MRPLQFFVPALDDVVVVYEERRRKRNVCQRPKQCMLIERCISATLFHGTVNTLKSISQSSPSSSPRSSLDSCSFRCRRRTKETKGVLFLFVISSSCPELSSYSHWSFFFLLLIFLLFFSPPPFCQAMDVTSCGVKVGERPRSSSEQTGCRNSSCLS